VPSQLAKVARLAGQLIRLPFVNPRGLREVTGILSGVTADVIDPKVDVLPIPPVTLEALLAEEAEPLALHIHSFPKERFSVSLIEAVALSVLMRKANARRAFEFGTHRGVSTTQLAANLAEDGELFTLDLPSGDRRTQFDLDNPGDQEVAVSRQKADLIPEELRHRIRFLEGDSAKFDPGPYRGSMDFIFVDAAHTAEYVRNDSEKAWAMLRPGGIVAWHDCRPQTPDVVQYLRQSNYLPWRIAGTTIAFAAKPVLGWDPQPKPDLGVETNRELDSHAAAVQRT
jgi:predicted O-methyltransferase YrrM